MKKHLAQPLTDTIDRYAALDNWANSDGPDKPHRLQIAKAIKDTPGRSTLIIESVSTLPPNLDTLLPDLVELTIRGIGHINASDLSHLPTSLKSLRIECLHNVTDLSGLPTSLTSLYINYCTRLRELSGLPTSLESLSIVNLYNVTDLSTLPTSLTSLNIICCSQLSELSGLPTSLTSLTIMYCSRLSDLSHLPTSLTYLEVTPRTTPTEEIVKIMEQLCHHHRQIPNSLPASIIRHPLFTQFLTHDLTSRLLLPRIRTDEVEEHILKLLALSLRAAEKGSAPKLLVEALTIVILSENPASWPHPPSTNLGETVVFDLNPSEESSL